MPVRTSDATWNGDLKKGSGKVRVGDGVWEGQYNFSSRFEEGQGTNPEELVAAAHSACFSMALAAGLSNAGYEPESVNTKADVHVTKAGDGWAVSQIDLRTEASVANIDDSQFQKIAEETKSTCPISQLVKAANITLEAKLAQ